MLRYTYPIFFLIVAANTAFLPEYFRKCSLSDPKLNKCLTKSGIDVWPSIVKGDKSIHIQSLDPLHIIFLYMPINNKFTANASNVIISGLADMKINEIKLDLDKKIIDIYFLAPRVYFYGEYDIAGELISVPLNGQGTAKCIFFDMENHLHIEYKLTEEKGKHYIEILQNSMEYNISKFNIQMDQFGDMLNLFLNENWEVINNEVKGVLGNVLGEAFTGVFKQMFKKVSIEELFLE